MSRKLSNRRARRVAAAAGLGAGASLAWAGAAHAASFTVGTTDDTSAASDCATDNTDCSLRQAITLANGDSAVDVIGFHSGLSGTIALGSDLPAVTQPLTIQGPGADVVTIDGQSAHRIFDLVPATAGDPVLISGLTLTGGNPNSSSTNANRGGAILNETADLSLADSIVTGNTSGSYGAGIYSGCGTPHCPPTLAEAYSADLTLARDTFSGNTTSGGGGGAVYLNYGAATIFSTTMSGNSGETGGAMGIFDMDTPVQIYNSTFSGNRATGTASGDGYGGAIYIFYNPSGVTLTDSTIVGNSGNSGGGISWENDAGQPLGPNISPVLHNTIVAGNTATTTGPDLFTLTSSPFDSAFSLIGSTSGAAINETVPGSDITGVDPKLGPLAPSAGGTTETMTPLANSPVIDKGDGFGVGVDQHGYQRPVDLPNYKNSAAAGADGSDIGAVELQSNPGGGDENAFTVARLTRNKKKGTATITLTLPDPGTVALGGKGVAPATAQASRAHSATSQVTLTIRSAGKARKQLKRKGKVRVKPTITFTPSGGPPSSQSLQVTLRKKRPK